MSLLTFKLVFSTAKWLVRSRMDSTQEINSQDWNCTQVSLIPVHNFKVKTWDAHPMQQGCT
jgi:hypothetical protein